MVVVEVEVCDDIVDASHYTETTVLSLRDEVGVGDKSGRLINVFIGSVLAQDSSNRFWCYILLQNVSHSLRPVLLENGK
jgi:hypothetical protein